MTTLYGDLVGTPKQTSTPNSPLISNAHERGKQTVLVRDRIELSAAAANTLIQCAVLGWETVLDPYASKITFDDLGTGNTLHLGDVTYANALVNAQDTASAAGEISALKAVDAANYFKPLWQTLGYATLAAAKAVSAQCELLFKINSAAATGTLAWQLIGVPRI